MSSHAGRRRSNVRQYSAEDQALTQISKEAENRLAAKRAARAEAREIRMKEIERQQREQEEKLNSENTGVSKARPHPAGSRRGSDDSSEGSGDAPSSKDRDLRMELRALEEKYKTAMMSSAQLDNEKQSLVYQVELLKDQLEEQAESYLELQREHKDKCRDLEMTKRELQAAQLELKALREANDCKDRLIAESGLIIVAAENGELALERTNESPSTNGPIASGAVLLSAEAMDQLNKSSQGSLGMHSLASCESGTTFPTPSSSASTAQQLGSKEPSTEGMPSRLVGDGVSLVQAASSDTLAQSFDSPDSCPFDSKHIGSSQTDDQRKGGLVEDIAFPAPQSETLKKLEFGHNEKEAMTDRSESSLAVKTISPDVTKVSTENIELKPSDEINAEQGHCQTAAMETATRALEDNELLTALVPSVAAAGAESGESSADGELSVACHQQGSHVSDSEQDSLCQLSTSHSGDWTSSQTDIVCDAVVPPDASLGVSENSDLPKSSSVLETCPDQPSIVVTACSHSQQTISDVTESEDDGEEFFDAVSTPLPSPCHLSSGSQVQELDLLKSFSANVKNTTDNFEEGSLEGISDNVNEDEEETGNCSEEGGGGGQGDEAADNTEADHSKEQLALEVDKQEVETALAEEGTFIKEMEGGHTEETKECTKEQVSIGDGEVTTDVAVVEDKVLTATEQEMGLTATEQEMGLTGTEQEMGLTATEQEMGLTATEQEMGLTGTEQEMGLTGTEQEMGLTGTEQEMGLTGTEQEMGLTGTEQEMGAPEEEACPEETDDGKDSVKQVILEEAVDASSEGASQRDIAASIVSCEIEGKPLPDNVTTEKDDTTASNLNKAMLTGDIIEEIVIPAEDSDDCKTPDGSSEAENILCVEVSADSAMLSENINEVGSATSEPSEGGAPLTADINEGDDVLSEKVGPSEDKFPLDIGEEEKAFSVDVNRSETEVSSNVNQSEKSESVDEGEIAPDVSEGEDRPVERSEEEDNLLEGVTKGNSSLVKSIVAETSVTAGDDLAEHCQREEQSNGEEISTSEWGDLSSSDGAAVEEQESKKHEAIAIGEVTVNEGLDKRSDLAIDTIKSSEPPDEAGLATGSEENSTGLDHNKADSSDGMGRTTEASSCGDEGELRSLIAKESADVHVPLENPSLSVSLKEEADLDVSPDEAHDRESSASAALVDVPSTEASTSQDHATGTQETSSDLEIPASDTECITTSSELKMGKESDVIGGVSEEEPSPQEAAPEDAMLTEEKIDVIDTVQVDEAASRDHSDGGASESSEALLDDAYDFDDIGEVLDSEDKVVNMAASMEETAMQEETGDKEDVASIVSKDSGLPESFADKDPNATSKDDLSSVTSQEIDVSQAAPQTEDSASSYSQDSESRKSFLDVEGSRISGSVSMDSLDLETKLDSLAATTPEHGRKQEEDDKVKALASEKKKLLEENKRLHDLLDDEQTKSKKTEDSAKIPQINGPEMQLYEIQREASKQIHDYKFKLQKAEQDIATLEGMVGRLETQVKRYKADAERAESVEDELKQEKRKLQRELREAQTQLEELQNQNKHLTTRLDRIKQSRTALGIQ